MSETFTTPTKAPYIQLLQELYWGMQHRQGTIVAPEEEIFIMPRGTNIQCYGQTADDDLPLPAQLAMDAGALVEAGNFVNRNDLFWTNEIAGHVTAHFNVMNWLGFITLVGLSESGFKRARDWTGLKTEPTWLWKDEWESNFMRPGDICGPWTVLELQEALPELAYTLRSGTNTVQVRFLEDGYHSEYALSEAEYIAMSENYYASWKTQWENTAWITDALIAGDDFYRASVQRAQNRYPQTTIYCRMQRTRGKSAISLTLSCDHEAILYVRRQEAWPGATDIDGTGWTLYSLVAAASFASSAVSHETEYLGSYDGAEDDLLVKAGYTAWNASGLNGSYVNYAAWLTKWTFPEIDMKEPE